MKFNTSLIVLLTLTVNYTIALQGYYGVVAFELQTMRLAYNDYYAFEMTTQGNACLISGQNIKQALLNMGMNMSQIFTFNQNVSNDINNQGVLLAQNENYFQALQGIMNSGLCDSTYAFRDDSNTTNHYHQNQNYVLKAGGNQIGVINKLGLNMAIAFIGDNQYINQYGLGPNKVPVFAIRNNYVEYSSGSTFWARSICNGYINLGNYNGDMGTFEGEDPESVNMNFFTPKFLNNFTGSDTNASDINHDTCDGSFGYSNPAGGNSDKKWIDQNGQIHGIRSYYYILI